MSLRNRLLLCLLTIEQAHAAVAGQDAGLAASLNDLGVTYHNSGRITEAERAYKDSISRWRLLPEADARLAVALSNLGGLRLLQQRPSEAEKLFRQARAALIASPAAPAGQAARTACGLADALSDLQRYAEARWAVDEALAITSSTPTDPLHAEALFVKGKIARLDHREQEAEPLLRKAVALWRESLGVRHPTYGTALIELAVTLSPRNPGEAEPLFREALAIIEAQLGAEHIFTGRALLQYAKHLESTGRKDEARRYKRRGQAIVTQQLRSNGLIHTVDLGALTRSQPVR